MKKLFPEETTSSISSNSKIIHVRGTEGTVLSVPLIYIKQTLLLTYKYYSIILKEVE